MRAVGAFRWKVSLMLLSARFGYIASGSIENQTLPGGGSKAESQLHDLFALVLLRHQMNQINPANFRTEGSN